MATGSIYVITSLCTSRGVCWDVCPVDCIRHAAPGVPEWGSQSYIDPYACIGCEACAEVCPMGAIFSDETLPLLHNIAFEVNRAFFDRGPGYAEDEIDRE